MTTPPAGTPPPEGEGKTPEQEQMEALKAQNDELQARIAEVSKIITSPEYAEFVAGKAKPAGAPKAQAPTQQELQALEERLNGMSRAQFAAFIRDAVKSEVKEEVKNEMWTPVMQAIISDKTQRDIASAEQEFPDFWDHKEQMARIAEAQPSLNVRQVYFLAKAGTPASAAPTSKPPVRRASGEPPTGPPAGPKPKQFTTAKDAFDEAFKRAGLE